jgi:16S rRNA (guanine1207-N2)-methyltransferase
MRRPPTPTPALDAQQRLTPLPFRVGEQEVQMQSKLGVRGYPELDGALQAIAEAWRRGRLPPLSGGVLDLSEGPGALPLMAAKLAPDTRWTLALTSAAALRAARATLAGAVLRAPVTLLAALPWEVPGDFDRILWRPPADRGVARVRAELAAVTRLLRPDGLAILLQAKEEGAARSEREAAACFAEVETFERHRGWRLTRLRGPQPERAPVAPLATTFATPFGPLRGVPGAFASEKLDAGSACLLRVLAKEGAAGSRVLDLGCGTGVLAQAALRFGAREVLAVDDDLAAVRASAANLTGEPGARVVHADLLTSVAGDLGRLEFDAVWCNPPFHVGRQVEEGLSAAFVEGAMHALRPAGVLTLVANRALRYQERLAPWGRVEELTPADEGRYRVWRVRRER